MQALILEDIIQPLAAILAGGIIGAEREYRSKSAGLRTITLICVGATIFTMLSIRIGIGNPDRIASNIVTGIGFLGAGVIFKEENRVSGLTTAAIIWSSAAIGMAIGSAHYLLAALGVFIIVGVMRIFLWLQVKIDTIHQSRNYRIACRFDKTTLEHYEKVFRRFQLEMERGKQSVKDGIIIGEWVLQGREKDHALCVDYLLRDADIIEIVF